MVYISLIQYTIEYASQGLIDSWFSLDIVNLQRKLFAHSVCSYLASCPHLEGGKGIARAYAN